MSVQVVREQPGGGLEAMALDGRRLTLWPGVPPPRPPAHPCLAQPLDDGLLEGAPAWSETRPPGPRLSELLPLDPDQAAAVLNDIGDGLRALHRALLSHGSLDAEHVVVDLTGHAALIGIGRRPGSPQADDEALAKLELLLDASGESTAQEDTLRALAARAHAQHPHVGPRPRRLPWSEIPEDTSDDISHAVDEVSLYLGEDTGEHKGLLDRWATSSSLGAITGAADHTWPGGILPSHIPARRVSILSRLAAPPESPPDPARFSEVEGSPSAEIKSLIADEPLDPIPLPDGVPARLRRGRPTPAPPELDAHAFATDAGHTTMRTTMSGRFSTVTEEVPRVALLVAAGLGLLALGAAVAVVWRLIA